MTSTWLPTVSPTNASSDTCGSSTTAGRNMNMPSPPSRPAENVSPKSPVQQRRGREHGVAHALPDRRPAVRLRGVDVQREHLVAQHPAVGAVGQLHAKPVVAGGAPDRRQHLAARRARRPRESEARARCGRLPARRARAPAPRRSACAGAPPATQRTDQQRHQRQRATARHRHGARHPHLEQRRLGTVGLDELLTAVGDQPGGAREQLAARTLAQFICWAAER